jgi:hypothetical protein
MRALAGKGKLLELDHASTFQTAYSLRYLYGNQEKLDAAECKGLDEGHKIIGIVGFATLSVQAALGFVYHANYRKQQRKMWASHAHLWTGRAVIIVGMLNAVLGFVLDEQTLAATDVSAVSW